MDGGCLDESYLDTLSQEEIESFCSFRSDVNQLRARSDQQSVSIEDAMKYLRASMFNAARAMDLYKNYQRYIANFQLDHLRPHREPLCSGIGSRKMEVVGTQDSEGSPIVLFTASRQEMMKYNHKSDMQLLFYTLDQAAKSKGAQENGLVFILDMRDVSTELRFVHIVISVLKDGYPLHTKTIYLVFNGPRSSKSVASFQKVTKGDICMVKVIQFSELMSYFSPEQLPPSIGGTFKHTLKFTSAVRIKPVSGSVAKDDLSLPKPLTDPSLGARRGSAGFVVSGVSSGVLRGSSGLVGVTKASQETNVSSTAAGGRKVNRLLEIFQSSHDNLSSSPVAMSQPAVISVGKPMPPANKPTRRPPDHVAKPSPAPPPKKPVTSVDIAPPPAHRKSRSKEDSLSLDIGEGVGGKKVVKVPLVPLSGGGRVNFANSSARLSHTSTDDGGVSNGNRNVEGEREEEKGGRNRKIVEQSGRVEKGREKKVSYPKMAEAKDEGVSVSTVASLLHSKAKTLHEGITKKFLPGKLQLLGMNARSSTDKAVKTCDVEHKQLFYGCNMGTSESNLDSKRRRADSVDTNLLSMTVTNETSTTTSSPRKLVGPIKPIPYGENSNESLAHQSTQPTSNPAQRKTSRMHVKSDYENVLPNLDSSQLRKPHIPPPPAVLTDKYENNMQYCNRDSCDIYENMDIGFAGHGGENSGPLPPIPLCREPVAGAAQPVKQRYENVVIKKFKKKRITEKSASVEDDDETLFGKEGPPGEEAIYENFGPDKGHQQMKLEELEAHVEKMGKKGLGTEYFKIKNEPLSGAHKACRLPCNVSKNRYKDVICYDETRVQLNSIPGKEGSDYIHANYVDGFNTNNAFILTQGPKDSTVPDFWRMLWEKHVLVIVMVTKCVELGKRKCAQYWPDVGGGGGAGGMREGGKPQRHGDYMVAVSDYKKCDGYDLTSLQVEHKGMERTLVHFQFLAWPDYGIPSNGTSILYLIFAVRRAQAHRGRAATPVAPSKSVEPHPIVVHCSAGVGRSGAFCSIDNCIWELDKQKSVNYQGAVRQMRKQRAYSVQTEEQYEFGYRTLIEYARNSDSYEKLIHTVMQ